MMNVTDKKVLLQFVDEINETLARYPNNPERVKVRVAFLREFVENIKGPDEINILSKIGFDTDARRI